MSARRSQARRAASGQQVRSRGLLVVTLVLIGAFVTGLAYLKKNTPVRSEQAIETPSPQAAPTQTAKAPPPAVQPALADVKPKYDFYSELPKRQLLISKEDVNQRPKRELQALSPARQEKPATQQQSNAQPPAKNVTVNTAPQSKPAESSASRQRSEPAVVEMPKIELISRRERNSPSSASGSRSPQTTAKRGNWMIQAGAYSTFEDADRVRARLSLLGIRARVEASTSNNRQIHRVRIGPILSKDAADAVSRRLNDNNIPSLLIETN